MGRAVEEHPQEEDAFLLNVWAPTGETGLPVFVFLHGGAFVSGGGTVGWYDGTRLAAEGRMVVVTVNYRLGPLAHMVTDGADDPNRSIGDLLQALQWVHDNIAHFGGDPDAVTLGGQSAGGFYSQLLAVLPASRKLVRRLFLMSAPGIPAAPRTRTESISRTIAGALDGADPRSVSVDRLLHGHLQAMAASATFGSFTIGLMPTVSGIVPEWLADPAKVVQQLEVTDLLITYTRDEAGSFFFASPERQITHEQLRLLLQGGTVSGLDDPYAALVEGVTNRMFGDHARQLGSAALAAGVNATVREFTTPSPLAGVGSGHCLDLPFLFGNREQWADAPMLDGIDDATFEKESAALRLIVTDLVHGRRLT
jgi:para-nitrobenzyl esterase